MAHNHLAIALRAQGKLDEAIAEHRAAIRLQPENAAAHNNLANSLLAQGKLDEAIAEFRAAIRLQPEYGLAHYNLGNALHSQRKREEAIAEFRDAIRFQPESIDAHYNLGYVLLAQAKLEEAIAEFRTAIRLRPDYAGAHANLGVALCAQGNLDEGLAELRSARDRGGPRLEQQFPGIGQRIAGVERQIHLRDRLPILLKGQDRPASPAEGIDFALLCYDQGLHAASARLYAEALKADPKLGDDRRTQHPYNAACAAALAGCGKGKDVPAPDENARAKLRGRAHDWLKAELAAWSPILDGGDPKARTGVARTLNHWKVDTDLAGIRDPDAMSKLPEAERKAWQTLWADVDRLIRWAGAKP